MRILMLGNSYTFYHDMPDMVADLLDCTVEAHTRGGARLAEQLNPETEMGARTLKALTSEVWDYVVLQEMSNGPITAPKSFFASVAALCEKIRENGAVPVLYATWAYAPDGEPMAKMGCTYEEMFHDLYDAYHRAAQENDALIADVGQALFAQANTADLYMPDGTHPTLLGSQIAARTISQVIRDDWEKKGKS
jgi:lysophospholipase L1-like esterase